MLFCMHLNGIPTDGVSVTEYIPHPLLTMRYTPGTPLDSKVYYMHFSAAGDEVHYITLDARGDDLRVIQSYGGINHVQTLSFNRQAWLAMLDGWITTGKRHLYYKLFNIDCRHTEALMSKVAVYYYAP